MCCDDSHIFSVAESELSIQLNTSWHFSQAVVGAEKHNLKNKKNKQVSRNNALGCCWHCNCLE